jgi:hypothetical protein
MTERENGGRVTVVTEAEWLACTDTGPMVVFLRGKATDRKWWLFACACCRRVWHLLSDERSRRAVDVAERYADGKAGTRDKEAACAAASDAVEVVRAAYADVYEASRHEGYHACLAGLYAAQTAYPACLYSAAQASEAASLPRGGAAWAEPAAMGVVEAAHCQVLRDIFGLLPFRPITLDRAWLTWHDGLLVSMAQQMYDSRDFSDLPILADALEEAGCSNQNILAHCRSGGESIQPRQPQNDARDHDRHHEGQQKDGPEMFPRFHRLAASLPGFQFFLGRLALTLPFCNFFWRFGYFVAGFRTVRWFVFAMCGSPLRMPAAPVTACNRSSAESPSAT